jgi:hypothetical protein
MALYEPLIIPAGIVSASQVWVGSQGAPPLLVVNQDPTSTIYVGYRTTLSPGAPNALPIAPGESYVLDGTNSLFAVVPAGTQALPLIVVPGGTSYFQPTTLSNIGGIACFVQATMPVGSGFPINSIWFDQATQALYTWNGSTWIQQEFNATELITAGTIVATLIAAGTIVAGIVNGTTITAATFIGSNAFFYQGTPGPGNPPIGWVADVGNDPYGNTIPVTPIGTQGPGGGWSGLQVGTLLFGGGSITTPAQIGAGLTNRVLQLSAPLLSNTDLGSTVQIVAAPAAGDPYVQFFSEILGSAGIRADTTLNCLSQGASPGIPGNGLFLYADVNGNPVIATQSGLTAYPPLTQADTGTNTLGNSTSPVALTRTWNIPAGDAVASGTLCTIYEIETTLNGTVEAASRLNLGVIIDGTFTLLAPIVPGYAAGDNFTGTVRLKLEVTATGGITMGTWNEIMDGSIQDGTATRTPATSMAANGIRIGIAVDTTVTHNIAIGASWNAAIAGQTVTGYGSKYTRYGL